jgi:hypothetical protein
MSKQPQRTTVLHERDDDPLANTLDYATADTSIVLTCPACETLIRLGPRTGPHAMNLPWLAEVCPTCGARFRIVQSIEITWQPR